MLVKLIKSEGVTFTHGVPTILQMLLDAAVKASVDLTGLKMVIGGSALPKALAKRALAAVSISLRAMGCRERPTACRCCPCSIEGSYRRFGRRG